MLRPGPQDCWRVTGFEEICADCVLHRGVSQEAERELSVQVLRLERGHLEENTTFSS